MRKVMVGTYAYADSRQAHQLVASETLFPGDTKRDFTANRVVPVRPARNDAIANFKKLSLLLRCRPVRSVV